MHAHRAQKNARHGSVPTAPHDQKIRMLGSGNESRGGVALNDDLADVELVRRVEHGFDDFGELLPGLFVWIPPRRPGRFTAPY